jgi:adenylate cyclase
MGTEIERKFLVIDASWKAGASGVRLRQGYLTIGPPAAVRVRVVGDRAFLSIKKATLDIIRDEFEYPIPKEDAEAILRKLCEGGLIEKTRYPVEFAGMTWEIDEFHGANEGLVIAEIELEDEFQDFQKPPWLGAEVSRDRRYFSASLSRHPYAQW